jgi:hypothetical protein
VVPDTLLVSIMEVKLEEQIACDAGVAVTTGKGFTITLAVLVAPGHPLDVGVTV